MKQVDIILKFDEFSQIIEKHFANTVNEKFDLSLINLKVLIIISKSNKSPSQTDLSEQLGIEKSYTVKILDTLTTKELLIRTVNPTNRRENLISLTDKGEQLVHEITNFGIQKTLELLEDTTPTEQEIFIEVLNKMINRIKGDQHD